LKAKKDIVLIFFFTLSGFLLFFYLISLIDTDQEKNKILNQSDKPSEQIKFEYGIPVNYYDRVDGRVRANQSLSTILNPFNISLSTIDKLNKLSRPIFDVRKIKKGQNYYIYYEKDSLKRACFFVYENTRTQFIVFSLNEPLDVSVIVIETEIIREESGGYIESSLWNSMADNSLDPLLAISLEDIFQWTIDFFSLQKGDSYKIIYENKYVEGESIGAGKIIAAEFIHMGNNYYAIPFTQDSLQEFYDIDGNSLRRNFLKAPLKSYRISSGYSNRRFHPILKIYRPHHGIDYSAARGTEVHTVGDGIVTELGYQRNGGGRYIKIKHNNVYSTTYMHLNAYAEGIKSGIRVRQDQVIAYVGSSGLATGPHLDFRFYRNGQAVNPLSIKTEPVKGVPLSLMPQFSLKRDSLITQFGKINH